MGKNVTKNTKSTRSLSQVKSRPTAATAPESKRRTMKKKVANKKTYLVKLLRNRGIYSPELAVQVGLVAQLIVKTEQLGDDIMAGEYDSVIVEVSREGAPREKASAAEMLYLNYVDRVQRGLKSLGLNFDARERRAESDSFTQFLDAMNDD
ncbi:MAG: hypothetical protein K2J07_04920 [Muribaculaceae bacterium]|nr:hypothetical protein [Muribaculaceae bacterium]